MEVMAYLNHGHWKVSCPKCGTLGCTSAEKSYISPYWTENNEYVCPHCYPDIIARDLSIKTSFRFDYEKKRKAKQLAKENGDLHTVIFPKNKIEIENLMKNRPEENRNWFPGESIKFLKQENKEHGV